MSFLATNRPINCKFIVNNLILRHGIPKGMSLLSDQVSNFEWKLIKELCELYGINKMRSLPYHPAGNGAVERENRSIKELIRSYTVNSQNGWDQFVPQIVHARNTSIHASTGYSPYEMVYGRKPNLIPQEKQLCSEYLQKLGLIKRRIEAEAVKRIEKGRRRRAEPFKEKRNYKFHLGDLVLITNEANHPGLSKKLERRRWVHRPLPN